MCISVMAIPIGHTDNFQGSDAIQTSAARSTMSGDVLMVLLLLFQEIDLFSGFCNSSFFSSCVHP
jgi:hypothetical protein